MAITTNTSRPSTVMGSFSVSLILAIGMAVFGLAPAEARVNSFDDVSPGHQFHREITWLSKSGITTGYADGTFRPEQKVSREAFAAFLYRLEGSPRVTLPTTAPFKDVKPSDQFYKQIVWLQDRGITTGYADGTFRPKTPISRAAIAAFLYRYSGRPAFTAPSNSPFKDMRESTQFFKEVTWLQKSGITTGYSDGTFRPYAGTTRAAIAAFLYRGYQSAPATPTPKPTTDPEPKGITVSQVKSAIAQYQGGGSGCAASASHSNDSIKGITSWVKSWYDMGPGKVKFDVTDGGMGGANKPLVTVTVLLCG